MVRTLFAVGLTLSCSVTTFAADWPMERGTAGRTAYTAENLQSKLKLRWSLQTAHPPQPAWPRDSRMAFDRAHRPVIADGKVFFGSSADDHIYALDAESGKQVWSFCTDGPVRFAPVVWQKKVFAVSDDGYLYCLTADDGKVVWKQRGGPKDDRVLGNGRIISRWPARGGPVIKDGVLYYAAGIWQSEKVFICAIDAASGKTMWTNDTAGGIYMAQPHGGAYAKSGVTAQGHFCVDETQLYVPTGRAVPAVFDRKTGKFLFYKLQINGRRGGTQTMVADRFIYNGGYAYIAENGVATSKLGDGPTAAFADGILHCDGKRLLAAKQVRRMSKDRKGKPITVDDHEVLWQIKNVPGGEALIVAGNTAVSGGNKVVALIDLKTKQVVSTQSVDGVAHSLAVSDGRLFVATDKGTLFCFEAGYTGTPKTLKQPAKDPGPIDPKVAAAAKAILSKSQIEEGYCLDLGCGDGALSLALAQRSKLRIVAVDSDPQNVAAARKRLAAAGLYGARVTVHLAKESETHFPKYFANLVVSQKSIGGNLDTAATAEAKRLQRPYGGMLCLGTAENRLVEKRGALKDAGEWNHLYSNPANTACSVDAIKGPLSVLWFGDVDLELPQRHGRGPSPLFHKGRLIAEGLDELRAVDAYNGRTIWRFALPGVLDAYNADHIVGVSQTGSNFCAAGDSVYVRRGGHCYRLDAATGKVLGKFPTPKQKDGKPGRWGYLASEDGILFGSLVNTDHIVRHAWRPANSQMKQLFTESRSLFAMDAKTGKLLWRYDAKDSIRNNAIAIGDGRVFLIDRPPAEMDRLDQVAKRRGKKTKEPAHRTGTLISLDAKTGKQKWTNGKDIFGTVLAFSDKFDMLMMSYQSTRFRLPSEVGGRMAVFRATEGYRVWDKKVNYVTRPLINDRTIYAQGGGWDLLTGDEKPFKFKRAYGCGQISASKNLFLFRSGTLGYLDLTRKEGTESFGGIRPGCWINALPAGGLVFIPDASAGCTCSYQNRSWVALQGQ